jgi:phosphinothricin acetyltransferase
VFGLSDDVELPEPPRLHGDAAATDAGGPTLVATPEDVLVIRPADGDDDIVAMVEIYNSTIATTTAAWTEERQTVDDRRTWMADRAAAGDVVLVGEEDGEVVGFAGYGEFRDNHRWPGYRGTVEHTIHVHEDHRGEGIGGRLIEALIAEARDHGLHVMVAAIDGANDRSYRFHADHGFVEVARMPEVGRKFDRWLDLVLMQRFLGDGPGR